VGGTGVARLVPCQHDVLGPYRVRVRPKNSDLQSGYRVSDRMATDMLHVPLQ
jgi:hypothetical protein